MKKNSSYTNKKAILVTCDDNYIKGLIALMNSIIRNIPGAKIYLVHDLSLKNFNHIKDYIYKSERFNTSFWKHLPLKREHVTIINQGKYQVDFLEESHLFYVDCDAIINKPFEWETPSTMTCDIRKWNLVPNEQFSTQLKLIRCFILKEGGYIEKGGKVNLYYEGGFFANKCWIINVFRPEIIKCSMKFQDIQTWYGLNYFNAAIGILKRPVKLWKLKQIFSFVEFLKKTDPEHIRKIMPNLLKENKNTEEYDLIHFLLDKKPWQYKRGSYPYPGGDIWWNYYLNGPIEPIDD